MKEKLATLQPEDATHYMEGNSNWVGTWFKKDENGEWLGRTDSMNYWCKNCGYEEDLIKPIPVNYMHKAAPKMYAMLERLHEHFDDSDIDGLAFDIRELLAEARGE